MRRIRVALCQIDNHVGDLDGNVDRILAALDEAEAAGADLAAFPELAITGYPPEDLLLKPSFVTANRVALEKVAARSGRCAAIVGFVDAGLDLHNAAAVCTGGEVRAVYHKHLLPNSTVFDERRYFEPGREEPVLVEVAGVAVGISICEDAWSPDGPIRRQAAGGAELMVNINASPYFAGRLADRERVLGTRAADASTTLVYVNQVGGQDELVFDGASMVFSNEGDLLARAPQFEETVLVTDLDIRPVFRKRLLDPRGRVSPPPLPRVTLSEVAQTVTDQRRPTIAPPLERAAEVYTALVTGTRDYATKNGFTDVVLGLSGGIDSSVCTAIAADALGPEHVHAVALPSRFSSEHSITDAEALCANLGVELRTIAIEPAHTAMLHMLAPSFEGLEPGVAEENLQGRIRAAVLMALANKFPSWLVLICGNKSELAVGYTTIYGVDMAGGFAPIKDVSKTTVYELARWRNTVGDVAVIPESVIAKAPSAELRPGQTDADSLPPYEVLDPILELYVEGDHTAGDLEELGFDPEMVRHITRLVDVAEWKRRQAPVGVRVTPKAFGKDRRLPITNAFRG